MKNTNTLLDGANLADVGIDVNSRDAAEGKTSKDDVKFPCVYTHLQLKLQETYSIAIL